MPRLSVTVHDQSGRPHVAPPFSYMYIVHMKRVTATDARKNWFRLLDEVAAGEVVCLERRGHRILITRDDRDATSDRIPDYAEFLSVRSPEDADRWGWEWSREGDLEPTTREDNG